MTADKKIKAVMVRLNLTQGQLGMLLGVDRITVNRWAHGAQPNDYHQEQLDRLAMVNPKKPVRRQLLRYGPLTTLAMLLLLQQTNTSQKL